MVRSLREWQLMQDTEFNKQADVRKEAAEAKKRQR